MTDITGHHISQCLRKPMLRGAEPVLFLLSGLLFAVMLLLPTSLGRSVIWADFLPAILLSAALAGLGLYARLRVGAEKLALATIGVALFLAFSTMLAVVIFALFPLQNPVIDPWLIAVDARLGYDWAGFVIALADYPMLGRALAVVYNSAVPQLLAVVILLGALGRTEALHRLLLVALLSLIVAVCIWWLWPSVGPSAWQSVPADVAARIDLVFASEAGAMLRQLLDEGPAIIAKETIVGVVGFPSYHTVMACIVAWFTRGTWAFPLAGLLSALMLPAILSHGGHNLVDVLGGLMLFAAMTALVTRALPDRR